MARTKGAVDAWTPWRGIMRGFMKMDLVTREKEIMAAIYSLRKYPLSIQRTIYAALSVAQVMLEKKIGHRDDNFLCFYYNGTKDVNNCNRCLGYDNLATGCCSIAGDFTVDKAKEVYAKYCQKVSDDDWVKAGMSWVRMT